MKKKYHNIKSITEKKIIDKYLKKLNFNKKESFDFDNDAAYLISYKNKKNIVTNDSILENVDFFKNDNPKSIAQKIVTSNLSDLSAMGANPYCYTLNICLPEYISIRWFEVFSKYLFKLQKKYNFFLLGGDLSKSKELMISSTFFGQVSHKKIISRTKVKIGDDIWVTGNLGESYVGLKILQKKIHNIFDNKIEKYFLNKYYFPKPCMIGSKLAKYCTSGIDISDGFLGDLKKITGPNYGANIYLNSLPKSFFMKKLIKNNILKFDEILNCGDDYELILTAQNKYSNNIKKIAMKNKIKISKVGIISKTKGFFSDSGKLIVLKNYFQHFA